MAGQDSQKLYTKIFFGIVVLMLSGGMLLYLVPTGPAGSTTGVASDAVAKVGDQTITVNDVRQQVQQLTQRQQVPPQMMPFYEQEVLRRLLVEKEMDFEANRLGITVSNDEIADRIRQILPAAFNNEVPIPPDQYTALVQGRTGMTVSQFEDAVRKGMLQEKFSKLVTDGISVGPAEIQQEFNYRNQKVKLDYAFIKPEDLEAKITPTDAEIKAFYDKNKTRYQVPEKRVVQYAVVDVNQIRELIKVVETSDISEIVIEEGDAKVTVRRGGVMAAVAPATSVTSESPSAAAEPAAGTAATAGTRPAGWKTVVAPMVGTFYASPAPGSAPFVQVGDTVSEGQPLCILEAMKLMNEISAEEPGIIREIVASNGDLVEYGSILFYYESA